MAWTPYIDSDTNRRNDSLDQMNTTLIDILIQLINGVEETNYQLKLLNARFEEAFETQICCEDIQ